MQTTKVESNLSDLPDFDIEPFSLSPGAKLNSPGIRDQLSSMIPVKGLTLSPQELLDQHAEMV